MSAEPRARTLRSAAELAEAGLIDAARVTSLDEIGKRYAIALTPDVAGLIDPADPADPVARQYLPREEESVTLPEERADPIGDAAHAPLPGIVHRYPDRVLLKLIHICPVYCRFCFRRSVVGPKGAGMASAAEEEAALSYIREHPQIWEVILTGGDPFMLSARRIEKIMAALGAIEHVKIVRWHTRVPVADPARVTAALVKALRRSGKTVYVAIHANHPREFTPGAQAAIARLADASIALISQSVLLRGVNDDVDTLGALMRRFVENRVKPYYLHHADLAPGTGHFRLPLAEARALLQRLRGRLSGLCQPVYVLDIPGGFGKAPVGPVFLEGDGPDYLLRDFNGRSHPYGE